MRWPIALVLLTAACATRGEPVTAPRTSAPPPPAAKALAYGAESATIAYEFSDTSSSDIQAGAAGAIRVSQTGRGTVQLAFEPSGGNQQVTLTLSEFSGSFSNSAGGGTMTATAADMKGPAILTVTPRGAITITQRPEITQAFRSVAGSENLLRRFFIRLPATVAQVGTVWTDTVRTEETNDGLTSKMVNISRSTYVRDTVVAGRTLNIISTDSDRTVEVSGTTQGVEIVQRLRGAANAVSLWDPEQRALVSRTETAQLGGTFDLPAMGMTNLPISSNGRSTLRLK